MGKIRRFAWALRKVRLPVSKGGLVLDVGAGGCPYPRSDVLLDRFVGAQHRCGSSLVVDRPLVIADAMQMPFKDKVFDFIVASHVFEHVKEPDVFLKELMRVGRAGYIETPNVIFERLDPYPVHCLEIMVVQGKLVIRKKGVPVEDPFVGGLKIIKLDSSWRKLFVGAPDLFHVRYFWKDHIDYLVANPEESCDWIDAVSCEEKEGEMAHGYEGRGWRGFGLRTLRRYYQFKSRGRSLDWLSILACPVCRRPLEKRGATFRCASCSVGYPCDPHPDFTRTV